MHQPSERPTDGSEQPPGWTLPGYTLERLLGFGATGEVWQAVELATGTQVALKRLRPGGDADAGERLRHEAAALTRVESPYLVTLRTVRNTPDGLVLVLELAQGGSLAWLLAARGRLAAGEVVTLAVPIAEALATAHAAGVVHGDVTPSNILFAADGRPLLADLGVAQLAGAPAGPVDGTAEYLDPMVALGGRPGPAADVHGLAACCYHALTGRAPYQADLPGRPDLAAGAPDCPSAVVEAVTTALDPDPSRRPDAAAFGAALRAAAPPAPVRLVGGPVGPVPVPVTRQVNPAPVLVTTVSSGRRWPGVAVAVVVALVMASLAGVLGVRVLRGGEADERAADGVVAGSVVAGRVGAGSVVTGTATPAATTPGPTGPRSRTDAPTADPLAVTGPLTAATARQVVVALQAARDAALVDGDPTALRAVYAPDTQAGAADEQTVATLTAQQATAVGLHHGVTSVEVVDTDGETAQLRVTDRLDSYQVLAADGSVLADRPARGEQTLVWQLSAVDGRWRIAALQQP